MKKDKREIIINSLMNSYYISEIIFKSWVIFTVSRTFGAISLIILLYHGLVTKSFGGLENNRYDLFSR